MLSQTVSLVKTDGSAVLLGIEGADGVRRELKADHVIAATGYRADVARLTFLSDQLRVRVTTLAGTPAVGASYQSSVPGLYFIGPAVASTFGPVMRFVYGSDHAARVVARRLAAATRSSPRSATRAAL
jgi:pyruvate/2-oxoglutarate dehydrogenase complex dihydrolipoamide dehydrogenase (E3) component